ncbi:MAG: 3-hydroxybutyryl-CoA dehydrogenase [Halioglobus sp.]|jgi:3-hydroxybutyryl-CoA dehydrogenase
MTIKTVGVAGCGTMGTGIAIVALRAGFETLIYDASSESVATAQQQIEAFLQKSVERGKLEPDALPLMLKKMRGVTETEVMADCDIVIEAVYEDLKVKHDLLQALHAVCPPETIFASNTSTISITEIAGGSGRPERTVGMHFCLPAQLMKLVEMSPGLTTSDETFSEAWSFCEALGQSPVKTQDTPGFILNYFVIPFNNDAIRLVEQGVADAQHIDKAIEVALGYPMGPLKLLDLIGMDTQRLLSEAMHGLTNEPRAACPPLVKRMIAANRLGKKSGAGFHTYGDSKTFGA